MESKNIPQIDVDQLMQQIQLEVERSKVLQRSGADIAASSLNSNQLPHPSRIKKLMLNSIIQSPSLKINDAGYHVNDFLQFHDVNFLQNAYRGVLGRQPDSTGFDHFLGALRDCRMAKVEILGRLRYSPEGRVKAVKIKSLIPNLLVQSAFKIPLLGPVFEAFFAFFKLPTLKRNFQKLDAHVQTRLSLIQDHLQGMQNLIQNRVNEIIEEQEFLRQTAVDKADRADLEAFSGKVDIALADKADRADLEAFSGKADIALVEELRTIKVGKIEFDLIMSQKADSEAVSQLLTEQEFLKRQIEEIISQFTAAKETITAIRLNENDLEQLISGKLEENIIAQLQGDFNRISNDNARLRNDITEIYRQIRDHKWNILDQQRRITLLLEEARKRFPKQINSEQLNSMLGEEDHILDHMYASFEDRFRGTREDIKQRQRFYLNHIDKISRKESQLRVLDVGCGRGEWLELLRDLGHHGIGVDHNRIMIEQCRELGLQALEADAIEFLRDQDQNSLDIVTGFHIIEHLPLKTMIELFDESKRVLKPGGMIIFETPNPENVLVGSCNFYADPSHRNPVFPESLKFIVEQRGFIRTQILRLHKRNEPEYINHKFLDEIIYRFNMEQDYSIIGYKP